MIKLVRSIRLASRTLDLISPQISLLRPSITLPNVISIKSLKSFDAIGISSAGRGYSIAPKLLVFDGRTNERITDVDLKYELGDNQSNHYQKYKGNE